MQVKKFTSLMSIEQTPQQLHLDCWGLKKLFSMGVRRWGVRIGARKDCMGTSCEEVAACIYAFRVCKALYEYIDPHADYYNLRDMLGGFKYKFKKYTHTHMLLSSTLCLYVCMYLCIYVGEPWECLR